MFWRFLSHATACIASDQLFLLDLRQDRYFNVPGPAAKPMLDWLRTPEPAPAPDVVAAMLERSGIRRPTDPVAANSKRETVTIPETLVSPTWLGAPDIHANKLGVAAITLRTWLTLRRTPLQAILSRRDPGRKTQVDVERIVERSAAFDQARTFSPLPRRCLLDSLALSAWLSRWGVRGQLVFGVTARPFTAHCWLQTDATILNDSYDHVSRFTPILTA